MESKQVNFETMLLRCADKAYNFAFRLTGNDQDARDLVQEAFKRAFVHKDRYDPSRPLQAWVNRILHNVFLDSVRRYEHKHAVSLDVPPSTEGNSTWADLLPGQDPLPDHSLMKSEEESLVQQALNMLPIHYRNAVVLYDMEGLSYEEVAKICKCPIGTVCSRIHQGRKLLKKAFEKIEKESVSQSHE